MSGRRPVPKATKSNGKKAKKSIAGKRRRDSDTDSEDRDTKRPRVDEDVDFIPIGAERGEATSNLSAIETRAGRLAREQQESGMDSDNDMESDNDPQSGMDSDNDMESDNDPQSGMDLDNDMESDNDPQSPDAEPPEIGAGRPLVHPDWTKYPRKYMVDTGVNGEPQVPIDDEVYEIRDYLVRYKDFGLRAPSLHKQLWNANEFELPDDIQNLLMVKGSDPACLECNKWFTPDEDDCKRVCYPIWRHYMSEWARENVSIHKTPGGHQGYGAYLLPGAAKVKKGDYMGIYYGVVVRPDVNNGEHIPGSNYVFTMDGRTTDGRNGDEVVEPAFHIDSGMYGNWTRFSNSHCEPNTEVTDEQIGGIRVLAYRALKEIKENDEILINYGTAYFTERNPPMLCSCSYYPFPHKVLGHERKRQLPYPAARKSRPPIKSSPKKSPGRKRLAAKGYYIPTKNASRSFSRAYGYVGNVRGAIDGQEVVEVVDNSSPRSSSSINAVDDSDEEMEDAEPDEFE
ncbi:hypothetical protein QBC40DRAFT_274794 [Triangularia verruculosa]|uniref:SET domain-containing protein n=1 Tax=Triangularia verruculosa TaxID=2587418 RepID=A0AAN7AXN8_9PEZI|nr:hypothetical protein QBC40DRAFT_274794 [Triangularia verruculosa]